MSTTPPPLAEVLAFDGHTAKVRCPYCGEIHRHPHAERGADEWRVPHCSMFLPPDIRAAGYMFRIPEHRGTASRDADRTNRTENR